MLAQNLSHPQPRPVTWDDAQLSGWGMELVSQRRSPARSDEQGPVGTSSISCVELVLAYDQVLFRLGWVGEASPELGHPCGSWLLGACR